MKKITILFILLFSTQVLFATNEKGPEGEKLLWIFLILVIVTFAFFMLRKKEKKVKKNKRNQYSLFQKKLKVEIKKDTLYYPDNLVLKVTNTRNSDVDMDRPLLIFDNFWLKRKFRLKGIGNRTLYPLYLEKGKTHTLQIDLTRFYLHDKKLKRFPKTRIIVFDMKGKILGSKSVFLRKTLIKF